MRISEIDIAENRRPLDDAKVQALADSIREVGLINPVTVDKGGNLIAGGHRVAACKSLGWTDIPVVVLDVDEDRAALAELDENLCRNEGTALERSEWLARRKVIYERLYPDTRAEEQRKKGLNVSGDKLSSLKAAPSFAADTAAKTGISKRTIQRDVRVAERLAPDVRDAIRDTEIADNKRALAALADEPAEKQRELVAAGPKAIKEAAREKRAPKLSAAERERLTAIANGEDDGETEEEDEGQDEFNPHAAAAELFKVMATVLSEWPIEHSLDPLISVTKQALSRMERTKEERLNG
jgi:ParB family chromosome partitioning protein